MPPSAASCSQARKTRSAPAAISAIFKSAPRAGSKRSRWISCTLSPGNEKPLVAAVGGTAVGIGTTMLLHCDHVVAATGAIFATPFLKLGLIPEAASSLLAPQRMGHARAFSLLVMGRPLSAADAKEAGIVNTVVDAGAVDDTALQAAREIAALPPNAVELARRLMRSQDESVAERIETEAEHFKELLKSDEARAAFAAFFARKK